MEAHGYNTYDYGFRGYYATIGRFTSMDPLCEQTPWQSPYAYAGNNFINCIDHMGLMGIRSSSVRSWVAVDEDGNIVDMDLGHWDKGVYEVDDFCDGSYWDLLRFELKGDYCGCGTQGWGKGVNITGQYNIGGGYYNSRLGCYVQHGTIVRNNADLLTRYFYAQPSLAKDALNSLSKDFLKGFIVEGIAWDNFLKNNKYLTTLQKKGEIGKIGGKLIKNVFNIFEAGRIGYDMYINGINISNVSDAVTTALSSYLADVVAKEGISGLYALVGMDGIYALGALAVAGVIAFPVAYVTAPAITDFNNSFGPEYWYSFWGPHHVPNSYLGL